MANDGRPNSSCYSWQQRVARSQLPPTQKLICYSVGLHFNPAGDPAYPRLETIARRASLTPRCVTKNLKPLIDVWLTVRRIPIWDESQQRHFSRYCYLPRFPESEVEFEPDESPPERRSAERGSGVKNNRPEKLNTPSPNPIPDNYSGMGDGLGDWFELLWSKYPNQAAKARAWGTTRRLNPTVDQRDKILSGLERWRKYADLKTAPLLASWLRAERWREALTRRLPWVCEACGGQAVVGDGRSYWCGEHDPERRPR